MGTQNVCAVCVGTERIARDRAQRVWQKAAGASARCVLLAGGGGGGLRRGWARGGGRRHQAHDELEAEVHAADAGRDLQKRKREDGKVGS